MTEKTLPLTDNIKIALERAGRLAENLPPNTCIWAEAMELVGDLEEILGQAEARK
jgi:hypothetical protein